MPISLVEFKKIETGHDREHYDSDAEPTAIVAEEDLWVGV